MDLRELEDALNRKGRGSRTKLASALGIDPSTINKIIKGEREVKAKELPIIEAFITGDTRQATPDHSPLYGFEESAEAFRLDRPPVRQVPLHPAQRGYDQVGSIEVADESMLPRYKPREIVYFVFKIPARRGDDAVIEMTDGSAVLREYVEQKNGYVWVKEYHPEERQYAIPGAQVKRNGIHAVVGRG